MAVKIKPSFLMLKKYGGLIPIALLSPLFFMRPGLPKAVFLCLLVPYYFMCFMGPAYLLRYIIGVLGLGKKAADLIAALCLAFEYPYMAYQFYAWAVGQTSGFSSAVFLIPFLVFAKIMVLACVAAGVIKVVGYGADESKEKQ